MIKGAFGVWEGSGVSSLTRAKWLQSARKLSIPCERVGGGEDRDEDRQDYNDLRGIGMIQRKPED